MEEPHLPRSNAHHYQQDPHHNPAVLHPEGEDENHHEKKSVLKKVKAKAKKIKNTLTKHGHNDDHDNNHGDEEDEDEEMVEDPEVHGAPIYESAAVRSAVTGPIGQPWTNLERPSITSEDRYDYKMTDPAVRPFNQWKEKDFEQPQGKLSGGLTAMDAMDHVTKFSTGDVHEKDEERNKTGLPTVEYSTGKNVTRDEKHLGGKIGKIGTNTGMEEDPHAPNVRNVTSHVQIKTTDPSGRGSEVATGITPILRSFGKMGIYDNTEQKPKGEEEGLCTGSHDQFAPETLPLRNEKQDSIPKSYNASDPQALPRDTLTGNPSSQSSNYTEKLASAATTVVGSAKSAKDAVASKLGYGGNDSTAAPPLQQVHSEADIKATSGTDYAHKIAATVTQTLAPVYAKVAGAGSSIVSKMQGTGTGADSEGQDKGLSVMEYLAEKLKPGEEDKALSEIITGSSVKHKGEVGKTTNTGEEMPTGGGRGVKEDIKDAFHKREPEGRNDGKPMGKVTESEEVARRLGTGDGEEGEKVAERLGFGGGAEAGGKGMVDRVKDAVGSWLGGKGEYTQTTPGTTYAVDNDIGNKGNYGAVK